MKADDKGKCLFAILTLSNFDVTQGQGQKRNFFLCINPNNYLVVRIILIAM